MDDELDKVRTMLGTAVTATVLKGREQYISLGKFEELLRITEESYDETLTIMQILVWLTDTETGDMEELNISGGGQLFIDRIRKQFQPVAGRMNRLPITISGYWRNARIRRSDHHQPFHAAIRFKSRTKRFFSSLAGLVVDEAHQFVQTASRIR